MYLQSVCILLILFCESANVRKIDLKYHVSGKNDLILFNLISLSVVYYKTIIIINDLIISQPKHLVRRMFFFSGIAFYMYTQHRKIGKPNN